MCTLYTPEATLLCRLNAGFIVTGTAQSLHKLDTIRGKLNCWCSLAKNSFFVWMYNYAHHPLLPPIPTSWRSTRTRYTQRASSRSCSRVPVSVNWSSGRDTTSGGTPEWDLRYGSLGLGKTWNESFALCHIFCAVIICCLLVCFVLPFYTSLLRHESLKKLCSYTATIIIECLVSSVHL